MSDRQARRAHVQSDAVGRLRRMIEIRRFEERTQELFHEGIVHGTTHLANGQEAVAVGLAAAIDPTDQVTCTYRGHGVALALGLSPFEVLAEIMGRAEGCTDGVGGSMHLSAREVGLMPTFAIIGAGIPVAAGAGLASQVLRHSAIGVAVFGDGATNIGAFHEALNLASIWNLPTLFVCENNHFGEYSRIDRTTPFEDLARRADSYAIPAVTVDGQDVEAVRDAVTSAVAEIRAGGGPRFIEAKTYRYSGHSRADSAPYRDPEEYARWLERDPIDLAARRLLASGELTDQTCQQLHDEVDAELAAVIATVRELPYPEIDAMFSHVYAEELR